jgi:hypothetical protein
MRTNQNAGSDIFLLLSPASSASKLDGTPRTVRRTLPYDQQYACQDHLSFSTVLTGKSGRRFYVDLTPTQQKMLLRQPNQVVNTPKKQLKETQVTNKLLQQFIDRVASSSKERGRNAAHRTGIQSTGQKFHRGSETRRRESPGCECRRRHHHGQAVVTAWSALGLSQQRNRLRVSST